MLIFWSVKGFKVLIDTKYSSIKQLFPELKHKKEKLKKTVMS